MTLVESIIQVIIAFVVGAVTGVWALLKRISREELDRIITEIKELIEQYNDAIKDGTITTEEKIAIAEQTIEAIKTILDALEE